MKTKQQLGLNEPRVEMRWWWKGQFARSSPALRALPRTAAGFGAPTSACGAGGCCDNGGLKSETEQCDLSYCLYYSSGITLVATDSFKTTTFDVLESKLSIRGFQTSYKRRQNLQERLKPWLHCSQEQNCHWPLQQKQDFLLCKYTTCCCCCWYDPAPEDHSKHNDTTWWWGIDIRAGLVLLLQSIRSLQAGEWSCEWSEAFVQRVTTY